ncbi:MAG TPA: DNA primase, partial [Rhizomicrobium sp.]
VETERRNYKCFGCGAGGDAFRWLMETEGLSFPEAVQRLAGEAGVDLPQWTPEDEAREQQKKSLVEIVELACVWFERQLRSAPGAAARAYLNARGLGEEEWKRFRLGYAPSGKSPLLDHLKSQHIAEADIVAAGLARAGGGERETRDFFFDRVMFPIGDARGRIVAFGARALANDAKPKYINTGETSLFSKGQLLYNLAAARGAALKSGTVLVAEGYMDVIALLRAGFEASVAPLGTALTQDQLALLWRLAPEPILSFDGDEAGLRAAHRAAEMALPLVRPGCSLRFALLPSGEDPDSLIRLGGAGAMASRIETAIPLVEMLWRAETEGRVFDTPERKAALIARLNERLAPIASIDVRRFYLEALAERLAATLSLKAYIYNDSLRASGSTRSKNGPRSGGARSGGASRPSRGGFATVSAAVKASRLVPRNAGGPAGALRDQPGIRIERPAPPIAPRHSAAEGFAPAGLAGDPATMRVKESEVLALLLESPDMLDRCQEALASLPFSDRSLDSLRHELLNLAASGFRLETGSLEDHLVRAGMAALVGRLKTRRAGSSVGTQGARGEQERGGADAGDSEARWLQAAAQLRELAETGPERRRALERFKSEASEESWLDWRRLHGALPSE